MKLSITILLLALLSSIATDAQQLTDSIGNFLILPSEKIPSNQIRSIKVGNNGCIYGGSRVGLVKYDGNKWNMYKRDTRREYNRVINFALDTNSVAWSVFNTSDLYVLEDGKFKIFEYSQTNVFYDVEIDKNSTIYASASNKVIKIDPVTKEYIELHISDDEVMFNIGFDSRGNLWGDGCSGKGVYEIRDDSVIMHTELNGINALDIYEITIIDTNYYAIATINEFKLFSNGSYKTINPPLTGDIWLRSFKLAADSTLLLSCNKGAYYYKNGSWSRLEDIEYAWDMCKVSSDSIYASYNSDGITQGNLSSRTQYRGAALDEVRSLEYFNSTLFIGADKGSVSQWDGSSIQTEHNLSEIFYNSHYLSISKSNRLYTSGESGIYRYDKGVWESINKLYNLPDSSYFRCVLDNENRIYAQANSYGLYVIDSTGIIKTYDRTNSPLGYVNNGLLYDSKDRLWVGTYDEYFWRGELYVLKDGEFTKQDLPISTGVPMAILEDSKGNIWVGNWGVDVYSCSLAKYDGTKWDTIHYETRYKNMNDIDICDIYEDYKGNIWLATGDGAYMYNGTHWQRFKEFGYFSVWFFSVTGDNLGNIYLGSPRAGTFVFSYSNGIIEKQARKLQDLKIYPNPTFGEVNIELQNSGESTILVYNQQGSVVYTTKATGNKIKLDLDNLAKGHYVINVLQDGYFSTSKVVVGN